jgi:virulence-associated protein VagC
MTIVSIDSQRRIYLPRELKIESDKALIIPRGENYLLIPIPKEITAIETNKTIPELKAEAMKRAEKETQNANRV